MTSKNTDHNIIRKKTISKLSVTYIFSLVLFLLGYTALYYGFNNKYEEKVNYERESKVDYKVYLNENVFFEEPFIEGKDDAAYITSLIDYLDIDFGYQINYDYLVSGSYSYSINATIEAENQNSTSTFWNKEYVLVDSIINSINDTNIINISKNVKIDYKEYNELLLDFKRNFNINMNGKLKVYLLVETNINNEEDNNVITNKESVASLEIPLTKATIEVPVNLSTIKDSNVLYTNTKSKTDLIYTILKLGGFTLVFLGLINLISFITIYVKHKKDLYSYKKELNRLLKTYDGIIVNVKNIPDLSKLNVINVTSFSELLDAHSEIRLPINYTSDNTGATFILFNEQNAWKYKLKKR